MGRNFSVATKIASMHSHTQSQRVTRAWGFTLIEMMVVVAIIAVVAAVAMPSYLSQVRASNRSTAIATLSQIQQAQERWRANCPCYAGSLTAANSGCPATVCANTSGLGLSVNNARYTFAMSVAPAASTPNVYSVTATAIASQVGDRAAGASCNTLTVAINNGSATNTPAACFKQ
jgi:type IV pilus assembly protein PilE